MLLERLQADGTATVYRRIAARCDAAAYSISVRLREIALLATKKALEDHSRNPKDSEGWLQEKARLFNHLGNRHSDLGQRELAFKTTNEAVRIFRKLTETRLRASPHRLAMSLGNLGSRHAALGQQQLALEATEEATKLFRTLVEARPGAFLHNLAGSLSNRQYRQRSRPARICS